MPESMLPNTGGITISTGLTKKMIHELKTGIFQNASRLPSETEMADYFKVSRSVIRDVMSTLEQAGFIKRGRGIGTLINRDIVNLQNRFDLKFEYNEIIQQAGYRPTTDSVKLYVETADEALSKKIGIDEGANVIICEKRVLANQQPVIYSLNYLPENLFARQDYALFDWSRPVFDLLEEHCSIAVDTSIATFRAHNGTPAIRQLLELSEGEALLLLDEVNYYKLSRPIMHTYAYYTNFFEFSILRKKI